MKPFANRSTQAHTIAEPADMSCWLPQLVSYALAGAIGTLAHLGVMLALVEWHSWPATPAAISGSIVGACINFMLNHHLIFASRQHYSHTAPRFIVVACFSILLNAMLMHLMVDRLEMQYLLAQGMAITLTLICTYVSNASWTFGVPREHR